MLNWCVCLCSIASGVQDSRIIFFSTALLLNGWVSEWVGRGRKHTAPHWSKSSAGLEWGLSLWAGAQQWGWEVGEVDSLAGSESGWRDLQGHAVCLNLWDSLPCELTPGRVNPFIHHMPTICWNQCHAAVGRLCCHFILLMGCTDGPGCFVVHGQLDEVGKSHQWWK